MRYRVHTLLIILAIGPPVLAAIFVLFTSPTYISLRFALLDLIALVGFFGGLACLWIYWTTLTKWI